MHAHPPAVGQVRRRAVDELRSGRAAVEHADAMDAEAACHGVEAAQRVAQVEALFVGLLVAAQFDDGRREHAVLGAATHLQSRTDRDHGAAVREAGAARVDRDAVECERVAAVRRGDDALDLGLVAVGGSARFDRDREHRPAPADLGRSHRQTDQRAVGQAVRHARGGQVVVLLADAQRVRGDVQPADQPAHAEGGRRIAAPFDARGQVAIVAAGRLGKAVHLDDVADRQRRQAAGHAFDDGGCGHPHRLAQHVDERARTDDRGDRPDQLGCDAQVGRGGAAAAVDIVADRAGVDLQAHAQTQRCGGLRPTLVVLDVRTGFVEADATDDHRAEARHRTLDVGAGTARLDTATARGQHQAGDECACQGVPVGGLHRVGFLGVARRAGAAGAVAAPRATLSWP